MATVVPTIATGSMASPKTTMAAAMITTRFTVLPTASVTGFTLAKHMYMTSLLRSARGRESRPTPAPSPRCERRAASMAYARTLKEGPRTPKNTVEQARQRDLQRDPVRIEVVQHRKLRALHQKGQRRQYTSGADRRRSK